MSTSKIIFKLIHKQLPHYVKQFAFIFRNQQHNYATRTYHNVFIPNVNHEIAKRNIRFNAPAAYNSTNRNINDKIYSQIRYDPKKIATESFSTVLYSAII